MGGKLTNILIGVSNIFLGLLIFVYEYVNKLGSVSFTKYQNIVMTKLKIFVLIYIAINVCINISYIFLNKMDTKLKKSYALFIPILGYMFYGHYAFGIIGILSGSIIIYNILRKNFVEMENNISMSVSSVLIFITMILSASIIFNSYFATKLKEKDQIGVKKYDENFFKLVSPVENEDQKYKTAYINIKKGNKFGYINKKGEEVVPFDLDFATPFYLIEKNDQKYYIAGFTKGEFTEIVLKNGRSVMSYKSENEIYDYNARISEFEKVVKDVIKPKIFQIEIPKFDNYYVYSKAYNEKSREERQEEGQKNAWTYRYDYSDDYDVLITESNMDNKNKYEFARKDDLDKRIKLDAEYLIYDKDKLYTLPGGYIPFFSPKEKMSGYFEPDGKRKKLKGMAKILYVEKDRVLIRNEKNQTTYFIDAKTGKEASPVFKEIIVDAENGRYIVKTSGNKWMLLNKNLERVFREEFDIVKTDLLKEGIYIFGNFPENIEFNEYNYAKINYIFANGNMEVIANNVNFFYDAYDKFNKKDITPNDYEEFKNEVSSPKPNKILDKYYDLIYNKDKTKEKILGEVEKEKRIQGPDGEKDLRKEKLKELQKEQEKLKENENKDNKETTGPENQDNLAPSLPDLE